MKNNEERIERYLAGELSNDELIAFELQLANDEKLAKSVEFTQRLRLAVGDKKVFELEDQFQHFGEKYFHSTETSPPRSSSSSTIWWLILLILLALSTFLIWKFSARLDKDQLFANYYKVHSLEAPLRGSQADGFYQQGLFQYQNQQYQQAATFFRQQLSSTPSDFSTQFALAHALLNQDNPDLNSATNYLQSIINHQENAFVDEARWYLALIYLKQGKIESAKQLLISIQTVKEQNIKTLLDDIKELN